MHKILVPIDGSDHSLKALHIACDLADKYRAVINLLYVVDPYKSADEILALPVARKFTPKLMATLENSSNQELGSLSETDLEAIGHRILALAAKRVERLGIETKILPLASGDPAENILTAYKLVAAGTIVMGSRGGTDTGFSPFGSVSQKVFAQANCTCISVK